MPAPPTQRSIRLRRARSFRRSTRAGIQGDRRRPAPNRRPTPRVRRRYPGVLGRRPVRAPPRRRAAPRQRPTRGDPTTTDAPARSTCHRRSPPGCGWHRCQAPITVPPVSLDHLMWSFASKGRWAGDGCSIISRCDSPRDAPRFAVSTRKAPSTERERYPCARSSPRHSDWTGSFRSGFRARVARDFLRAARRLLDEMLRADGGEPLFPKLIQITRITTDEWGRRLIRAIDDQGSDEILFTSQSIDAGRVYLMRPLSNPLRVEPILMPVGDPRHDDTRASSQGTTESAIVDGATPTV